MLVRHGVAVQRFASGLDVAARQQRNLAPGVGPGDGLGGQAGGVEPLTIERRRRVGVREQ